MQATWKRPQRPIGGRWSLDRANGCRSRGRRRGWDRLDDVITEASLSGQAPAGYPFAPELAFAHRLARHWKAQREKSGAISPLVSLVSKIAEGDNGRGSIVPAEVA